jgi:glutamate/aspartate transport system substrate-binding protein
MKRLIRSGEIKDLYEKWFLKPITPKNTSLNLKANHLLLDLWRFPSDFVFN